MQKNKKPFVKSVGSGVGGDKRKFWHAVMGYESPEVLRKALLAQVTVDLLQPEGRNAFGERYYAIVALADASGAFWQIRTCWIVLFGEDTARFVTAFPNRTRRLV